MVGYDTVTAIANAIARAETVETETLIDRGMRGLSFESVFGPVEFRPQDHQSTLGAFVGRTALEDGRGVMVDWFYADGRDYLPTDDVVRQMRQAT